MSRKLLLSSIAIAATATLLGVGTFAKFSDQETSATHSVKAGTLDLRILNSDIPGDGQYPGEYGTFAVTNAKPGDSGHRQIHFQNEGNVDGQLYVKVVLDSNDENGIVEPETGDPTAGVGELAGVMNMSIDGIGVLQHGTLASYSAMVFPDSAPGALWTPDSPRVGVQAGTGGYLAIDWSIPATVGNEIMSDSVTFHIELNLLQA
jgi:predicted ribosomally synthesized peptide with SipW-like signal peptide